MSKELAEATENFRVCRLRDLYQNAVRDLTGQHQRFLLSPESKNSEHFLTIVRKLFALGVRVDDFIFVIFNHFAWPRKMSGRQFQYPYLAFLSSDGCLEMFKSGARELKGSYGHKELAKKVISSQAGGTLEIKFGGCFYQGFDYLYTAVKKFGFAYFEENPINLVTFFFSHNDLFTPEFISLHKSFRHMIENYSNLSPLEKDLARVVCEYVSTIRHRAKIDPFYHGRLAHAYKVVRNKEGETIEKFSRYKSQWKRVWLLLR
jgi:hypothetical protein